MMTRCAAHGRPRAASRTSRTSQDWGGLIGLRLATAHPDRFARIVAADTGLPTGDKDPITGPMAPLFTRLVPGARGLRHPTLENAGHFLQEDAGERLGDEVVAFIRQT